LKQLVDDFPSAPHYRHELSTSHGMLGLLLGDLGRWAEAEKEERTGIALSKQLVADFPGVPDYAVYLGGAYCNLGNIMSGFGQPQTALEWYRNAFATLEAVLAQDMRLAKAREFLGKVHLGRARALALLHRHAETFPDWDRALELVDGPLRLTILMERAGSLVHVGDHLQATRAADELATGKKATGLMVYDAACIFSLASGSVKDDDKLEERYATRAIELSQQAVQKGYQDVAHMKKDTDLDPLRQREDFQKLIRDLEAKKPASPKTESKQ
jgi:tetratricopeptide (TPR) repeat protein